MDRTETYIKMCDCEELQGKAPKECFEPPVRNLNAGDLLWQRKFGFLICHKILEGGHFGTIKLSNPNIERFWDITLERWLFIWLPHQDQLQEMLNYKELKDRNPHGWFCFGVPGYQWNDDFGYGEGDDKEIEYYRQFTSMEQLWLAFVMKELWNKIWDGEVWIMSKY